MNRIPMVVARKPRNCAINGSCPLVGSLVFERERPLYSYRELASVDFFGPTYCTYCGSRTTCNMDIRDLAHISEIGKELFT
jgi:hypothetical protein